MPAVFARGLDKEELEIYRAEATAGIGGRGHKVKGVLLTQAIPMIQTRSPIQT